MKLRMHSIFLALCLFVVSGLAHSQEQPPGPPEQEDQEETIPGIAPSPKQPVGPVETPMAFPVVPQPPEEPAEEVERKPVVPVVDGLTGATRKYQPIRFESHDKHGRKWGCTACHHDLTEKVSSPGPCAHCHGRGVAEPGIFQAYHRQCRTCHEAEAEKNVDAPPPTSCTGCHPERK